MIPPISGNLPVAAPVSAVINHLLAQEPWARKELLRHAGKVAVFDAGSATLRLRVTADGMVASAPASEPAAVTIRVKLSDLPQIMQNRERAFSYVRIEGDAEFANTISSLGKSLRWEAEADLEKLIGPAAAVRAVSGARSAVDAVRNGQRKLAENVAEFLADEKGVLLRPPEVEAFSSEVTRLRDDVERAAKRLAKLEQKLTTGAQ